MVDGEVAVSVRADARRNTEALLTAARAAVDEQGLTFTTRDLARRAGVGLGTVHRRLPSLTEVISAVLIESLEHMTALAGEALSDPDPWSGFLTFADQYVRLRASSCGLNEALAGEGDAAVAASVAKLSRAVRALVRRAQRAGAIRRNLDWRDVAFALGTALPPGHTIGLTPRPDQWRRNLAIITAGLRGDGGQP